MLCVVSCAKRITCCPPLGAWFSGVHVPAGGGHQHGSAGSHMHFRHTTQSPLAHQQSRIPAHVPYFAGNHLWNEAHVISIPSSGLIPCHSAGTCVCVCVYVCMHLARTHARKGVSSFPRPSASNQRVPLRHNQHALPLWQCIFFLRSNLDGEQLSASIGHHRPSKLHFAHSDGGLVTAPMLAVSLSSTNQSTTLVTSYRLRPVGDEGLVYPLQSGPPTCPWVFCPNCGQ